MTHLYYETLDKVHNLTSRHNNKPGVPKITEKQPPERILPDTEDHKRRLQRTGITSYGAKILAKAGFELQPS
jgi:hypothetical protein